MVLWVVVDDCDLFVFDEGEVSVFVVENVYDGFFVNLKNLIICLDGVLWVGIWWCIWCVFLVMLVLYF